MINLNSDIKYVKGVGEKRAQLFNKLGIFLVRDLLSFYPRDYRDFSKPMLASDFADGETATIKATLVSPVAENFVRKNMVIYKCDFSDGKQLIHVTIFNNKYLAKALKQYDEYILFGKISKKLTFSEMSAPQIEKLNKNEIIHPIYRQSGSLSSKGIEKIVSNALSSLEPIKETLSKEILEEYSLVSLPLAVKNIHFPSDYEALQKAKKRLIFEELLVLELGLLKLKTTKKKSSSQKIKNDFTEEFYKLLPFTPTNAQKNAIFDSIKDMKSDFAMNRLIQGDVGSGKTAVAAGIIYTAIKNGMQTALMVPTEILANQHFESFSSLFDGTNISIALLTGKTKPKEKREIKEKLIDGQIDLIIGTHALIQNDVEFKNLGLIITDEQHRFGVDQRANLAMKGNEPHTLVMSATPIPRTLALMIYGDLDISVLNELPPNRQTIRTDVVTTKYHKRIYKFIKNAIDSGNQAYIICPLVEDEEEKSELIPATEYAEALANTDFKGYNIGLLHGKMKPKEKDKVMNAFASGDIKILVSTTVVEVGIDVPNATIIVIENAERFGLSQLHQLRGRVGRGSDKSYCILVSDNEGETSKERLHIMKTCSDGFTIADEDLKERGPGDFFGLRQHGLPDLKIADMLTDMETLKLCRNCANSILKKDFNLDLPENKALAEKISDMFRASLSS